MEKRYIEGGFFYWSALKNDEVSDYMYRVIFLTGPPVNLRSVDWKVTDFKKTLESQTGPPY